MTIKGLQWKCYSTTRLNQMVVFIHYLLDHRFSLQIYIENVLTLITIDVNIQRQMYYLADEIIIFHSYLQTEY